MVIGLNCIFAPLTMDWGFSLSVLIYATDRLKSVPLLAFHRSRLGAAQRVEVELQVPLLVRPDHLIPGHFAARVSRHSTEDRGQRGLGALFSFVVELAGFYAFDQRLHLRADRRMQVDLAGVDLVARLLAFLNLVENDRGGAALERLGGAVRAEEPLALLAVALVAELVRIEADVNVVRVDVGQDEMIAAQVIGRYGVDLLAQRAPADAHRLHRMRLHRPVDDVQNVDVLFDQNVARKSAVENPVADARLQVGHAGFVLAPEVVRVIKALAENDVADLAGMDALNHSAIAFVEALLESDVKADFALRLLARGDHPLAALDVGRYRLFAVDVLARVDGGFEVLGVEIRRAGDQHEVDVLRLQELLVSPVAFEEVRVRNLRAALLFGHLVEVGAGREHAVFEHVGQRRDADVGVV